MLHHISERRNHFEEVVERPDGTNQVTGSLSCHRQRAFFGDYGQHGAASLALNLTDTLSCDVILLADLIKRRWIISEKACLENLYCAHVQDTECAVE